MAKAPKAAEEQKEPVDVIDPTLTAEDNRAPADDVAPAPDAPEAAKDDAEPAASADAAKDDAEPDTNPTPVGASNDAPKPEAGAPKKAGAAKATPKKDAAPTVTVDGSAMADVGGTPIYDATGCLVLGIGAVRFGADIIPVAPGRYYALQDEARAVNMVFRHGDVPGLTNEAVLAMLIHRLTVLEGELPDQNTRSAISFLEAAKQELERRNS